MKVQVKETAKIAIKKQETTLLNEEAYRRRIETGSQIFDIDKKDPVLPKVNMVVAIIQEYLRVNPSILPQSSNEIKSKLANVNLENVIDTCYNLTAEHTNKASYEKHKKDAKRGATLIAKMLYENDDKMEKDVKDNINNSLQVIKEEKLIDTSFEINKFCNEFVNSMTALYSIILMGGSGKIADVLKNKNISTKDASDDLIKSTLFRDMSLASNLSFFFDSHIFSSVLSDNPHSVIENGLDVMGNRNVRDVILDSNMDPNDKKEFLDSSNIISPMNECEDDKAFRLWSGTALVKISRSIVTSIELLKKKKQDTETIDAINNLELLDGVISSIGMCCMGDTIGPLKEAITKVTALTATDKLRDLYEKYKNK